MHRSLARYSAPVSFVQAPSWADFITTMVGLKVFGTHRSYLSLERDSAPGTDGVTWQTYGENLEEKLEDLHDKVHRGSYRARPARRSYIPKADGSKRPLSIPTWT